MSEFLEACEEARSYASVELDEELSELDAARLRAHLNACPACALWVDRASALAVLLREAEWEIPAAPYPVPARRVHIPLAGAVAGLAASVAAVALAVVAVAVPSPGQLPSRQSAGDGVDTPGVSCPSCDIARASVRANFASAREPLSRAPRRRKYPGPI